MAIYLFETRQLRERFSPLTANKSILELLAGGITIRDWWLDENRGVHNLSLITEAFLSQYYDTEIEYLNPGDCLIFAGYRPVAEAGLFKLFFDDPFRLGIGLLGGMEGKQGNREVLAVRLKEKLSIDAVRKAIFENADPNEALRILLAQQEIQWEQASFYSYFHHPEDLLKNLGNHIENAAECKRGYYDDLGYLTIPLHPSNQVWGKHKVMVEEGAQVHFSTFNTENGPIYIGKDAQIMEGCLIRGPFFLGEKATLKMGTKIYGPVATGPKVVLGGEIKNCIFHEGTNKGHDGYLGDSIIGAFCNFGAGSGGSNVKNTGGNVRLYDQDLKEFREVGQKFGAVMGDYTRIGVGTQLTTGSYIGLCCNLFGLEMPPKHVAAFSWGTGDHLSDYQLEKALEHIDNWLQFKGCSLDKREIQILNHIFEQTRRQG